MLSKLPIYILFANYNVELKGSPFTACCCNDYFLNAKPASSPLRYCLPVEIAIRGAYSVAQTRRFELFLILYNRHGFTLLPTDLFLWDSPPVCILSSPLLFQVSLVHLSRFILIFTFQYWSTVSVTPGVLICVYLLSFPVCQYFSSRVSRIKAHLVARRVGARIAPRTEGILPLNLDLLMKSLIVFQDYYIGDPILRTLDIAGGDQTCTLDILGEDRILIMNPDNIKKILATRFENYCKGSTEAMLGVGVFNSDGEMWRFHRKSW